MHAYAQQVAPSRVTPETLRPPPLPKPTVSLPAPAGLVPPPNAERLSILVGHTDVAGTFPGFQRETAAIVGALQGKRVTVARIYDAANQLEQAYAAAGYFLARVVIPPQDLVDGGTLHLTVIDGVIERVEVKDVPARQRAAVMTRMAPVIGRHHVTLAQVERRLLLVSDIPGLRVRSTLSAGATPGGTLLVLQGTQTYATGSFSVANRLPASLGTWSFNATAALNSPLGLGEQAYVLGSSSPDIGPARLRVFGGGVVLPIGNDGLTLNPEYTKSMARPTPSAGAPATEGHFQRFAMRANYPLIRGRTENLSVQGSLEWLEEELRPIGFAAELYRDDYAAGRLRAAYQFYPFAATPVQLTGTLSHGLAGRSGTAALPLSRQGSGTDFTSALVEANLQHPLPASLFLNVTGRAQTSFDAPLMLSEQFSLDGTAALSAFADGTFSVDQGATLRVELSRPLSVTFAGKPIGLLPYVFGAGGWGELTRPTVVERRDIGAGSAGIGLRTDASVAGLLGGALGVEVARKFSDAPNVPNGYRVNFLFTLSL